MSRFSQARFACGLAVLSTVLCAPAVVLAESGETEIRNTIGGWTVIVERNRHTRHASGSAREQAAAALYADAGTYVNLKAWLAAERLLKSIIEKYPETRTADHARSDLAELELNVFSTARQFGLGGPITDHDEPPPTALQRTPRSSGSSAGSDSEFNPLSWLQSVDVLQDQFRASVGDRIFFGAYSTALGQRGNETLQAQIDWLKANPDVQITIEAHADEPNGASGANDEWAGRRAAAIRRSMIDAGIRRNRIRVAVMGARTRIAVCRSAACMAQNRRVVLKVAHGNKRKASR